MITLTIILTHSPHPLQFHFDKYADGEKALGLCGGDRPHSAVRIHDDYNCLADIRPEAIAAAILTDVEQEMKAYEQVELEKIRKDVRLNKKANAEVGSGLQIPGQQRFVNNN
jgi:hypothetical protein